MTSRVAVVAVLVFSAIVALDARLASANVLTNGDFESEPNFALGSQESGHYTVLTGSQIPGWTIEANHAVTVHFVGTYPTISGQYSVNTDGEGANSHNANFYQDFSSSGAQTYDLEFDWYGWFTTAIPHLDVTVTDTVTSSVLYHGDIVWALGLHHVSASFAGTGHTLRLRIQENPESGFNDDAFVVDNFTVDPAGGVQQAETPVPTLDQWTLGTLACLLFVAGAIAARRRRQ